jgi:hypothetical protein
MNYKVKLPEITLCGYKKMSDKEIIKEVIRMVSLLGLKDRDVKMVLKQSKIKKSK